MQNNVAFDLPLHLCMILYCTVLQCSNTWKGCVDQKYCALLPLTFALINSQSLLFQTWIKLDFHGVRCATHTSIAASFHKKLCTTILDD